MTHVEFIDCSGLRLLTAVLKATCEQHCSLVLCNLQPAVRMVLEISQLDKMFDIRREQPETVLAKSPRATAVGLTELAVS
jgi:anti-anti-sigma factor